MPVLCMRCDELTSVPVDPATGDARCPGCGHVIHQRLLPLFVVTGASASGKTAIVPELIPRLPECEVFDVDLLLSLATHGWDEYRNAWLLVAAGIAANGRPTVICGSVLPEQLDGLPDRDRVGPIHFLNLHCTDAVREARLRQRPAWREGNDHKIEEHHRFASWLVATMDVSVDTTTCTVAQSADQVAAWVRDRC
jgi:hypothetical protein